MRAVFTALPVLLAGCPCGGPFVAIECAASGVGWRVVDEDGRSSQPDAVRLYLDEVLIETLACAPLGDDCEIVFQAGSDPGAYRAEVELDGQTFTATVTVAPIDASGQCCGGFYEQGEVVVPRVERPDVCASLDAAACAREPTCEPVTGYPLEDGPCVAWDDPQAVACREPGATAAVPSLAAPPEAPTACVAFDDAPPDDWVPCDAPVPAACPT